MPQSGKLLAWVEPHSNGFLAAFVGGAARKRAPATRTLESADKAQQWIEREAAAIGVPVEWVNQTNPPTKP